MKLYLMIYLVGQMIGVVGPLTVDRSECQRLADALLTEADKSIATPGGNTLGDVEFRCELR